MNKVKAGKACQRKCVNFEACCTVPYSNEVTPILILHNHINNTSNNSTLITIHYLLATPCSSTTLRCYTLSHLLHLRGVQHTTSNSSSSFCRILAIQQSCQEYSNLHLSPSRDCELQLHAEAASEHAGEPLHPWLLNHHHGYLQSNLPPWSRSHLVPGIIRPLRHFTHSDWGLYPKNWLLLLKAHRVYTQRRHTDRAAGLGLAPSSTHLCAANVDKPALDGAAGDGRCKASRS